MCQKRLACSYDVGSKKYGEDLFMNLTIYDVPAAPAQVKTRTSKLDALKEIIRAWGLNPEEILTRNAFTQPHRTVIDHSQLEQNQFAQLTTALKQQMPKEIRENRPEKSIKSCLSSGSPGEIRTLVGGSKAQQSQNQACFVISDIDWAVQDFYQYCEIEERLTSKVCNDYKYAARRFLLSCEGEISRQAMRDFLSPYLQKAPKTPSLSMIF